MPDPKCSKPTLAVLLITASLAGNAIAQTSPTPPETTPPAATPPPVTPPPITPPANTPPPLPPVPQISVFVAQNGAQTGPFDAAQLAELAKSGALTADTLVWQEGMADWAAANTVPALGAILSANPPAADPVAYLSGRWSGSASGVPIPGVGNGTVSITSIYNPDNTVSGFGTVTVNSANGPLAIGVTIDGTYTAKQLDATTILLTPDVRVTYSAPGMAPESQQDSTPATITILSPTSFRDSDGIIYSKQ